MAATGAEDERRFQEILYSVVNNVVDGIITIDEHGRIESFNLAAEKIFGYSAREAIGRNVNMLMPEPYHSRHDSYISNYLTTGHAKIIGSGREVLGRRKDRSTFPMDLAVSEFALGPKRFFTGIVRDITERQRLEAELRTRLQELADAEERTRSVVDHVVDAIITIDARGVITTFNPAAERIFGYAREEAIGRNVKLLMPEADRSRHDGYIANYLRTGQAKIIGIGREVTGKRKDGTTFPMELAISEFHLGDQRFFTGIVRDITDRKHLEYELRRRLNELAEADQRKDQFISLLGHELRNPLAPVSNGLQILRRSQVQHDAIGRVVGMMERQVGHMVRLIDDLLDVSRITSGKIELRREMVELAALVQQALEAVRHEVDAKRQMLALKNPDQPLHIYADPVRVAQIVTNLVSNASKYSEPSSTIWVALEKDQANAVIRVKDQGIGIPPDKLESIFEIFVQIDPSIERRQGGLGLGLMLVRSLVQLHGGSVSAHSDGPGRGSEFTVSLPLMATQNGEREADEGAMPMEERKKVLIIDDNTDGADSLAALLKMIGHDVATLYGGESAVDEVARFGPDVILCDIGMPGMSGLDVAKQLRTVFKGKRFTLIAATGYGRPEDVANAKNAGFDAHLVKPVDLNQLEAAIRAAPLADVHSS
ncbi:MAG TPA: PAS domain S-box protein [Burkholderiales bacterium]|nr:PAS domain S-box protein [Burkholderiales bacterium]